MKNILKVIIIALILTSCKSIKTDTIKLKGNLGNYLSYLELNRNGDKFKGYFFYHKNKENKEKIYLEGVLTDNRLIINEFNNVNENSLTGVFNGKYTENSYSGFWTNPEKTKKVKFKYQVETQKNINIDDNNRIEYIWNTDENQVSQLKAKKGNKTYEIFNEEQQSEISETDFDGDGYMDLLTKGHCYSGNGCGSFPYYYISYNKLKDKFTVSKGFGHSEEEEGQIEIWKGKKSVIMKNTKPGEMYEAMDRYIFKNGIPIKIESNEILKIKALKEILIYEKSDEFKMDDKLFFDLNNDGKLDTISSGIWHKHMIFNGCDINFGNKTIVNINEEGMRIGVLKTKTKGYNDLVFHFDDIYIWNGVKYIAKNN